MNDRRGRGTPRRAGRPAVAAVAAIAGAPLRLDTLAALLDLPAAELANAVARGELAARPARYAHRLTAASAREFLHRRGLPVPAALCAGERDAVALVTDRAPLAVTLHNALGALVAGDARVYSTLVFVGAYAPAAVVIDLEIAACNPLAVLRAVAEMSPPLLAAVGRTNALFRAARAAGARVCAPEHDLAPLRRAVAALGASTTARALRQR